MLSTWKRLRGEIFVGSASALKPLDMSIQSEDERKHARLMPVDAENAAAVFVLKYRSQSLGDKTGLYFHDLSFTPLFIHVRAGDIFYIFFVLSPKPGHLRRKTAAGQSLHSLQDRCSDTRVSSLPFMLAQECS